jgi:hypothetical protein
VANNKDSVASELSDGGHSGFDAGSAHCSVLFHDAFKGSSKSGKRVRTMTSLDSNILPGESYSISNELASMPDHDHDVSMEGGDVLDLPKKEEEEEATMALPVEPKEEDAQMDDLFGKEEHEEKPASAAGSEMGVEDGLSDTERERRRALEYDEPDEEPEDQVFEEIIEAAVAIPKVPMPKSSDGTVCSLMCTCSCETERGTSTGLFVRPIS